MSELDFSKLLDALRDDDLDVTRTGPEPPCIPSTPQPPLVQVGAGAYRTAHIVPDVMPLPRPPWWVRAQAVVLCVVIGKWRAWRRQWVRRALGGHWSQVLDRDGDASWMRVPMCPATLNAHMHPAAAPPGVCFDDAVMVCHCERWP